MMVCALLASIPTFLLSEMSALLLEGRFATYALIDVIRFLEVRNIESVAFVQLLDFPKIKFIANVCDERCLFFFSVSISFSFPLDLLQHLAFLAIAVSNVNLEESLLL
jgi:hypothetical protein